MSTGNYMWDVDEHIAMRDNVANICMEELTEPPVGHLQSQCDVTIHGAVASSSALPVGPGHLGNRVHRRSWFDVGLAGVAGCVIVLRDNGSDE